MNEDLVARLRRIGPDQSPDGHVPLARAAANEIERLRSALKQALRQWSMYAEMVEGSDRDFALETEKSAEGDMYRAAVALANEE